MKPEINLITIWTDNIGKMKEFYTEILGFNVINDLGDYIEFSNKGVRFAICSRSIMYDYSSEYKNKPEGQILELAFECDGEKDLERTYKKFKDKGVEIISTPKEMPWGQKTSLFEDPDGNIHEIFTEI